MPGSRLLPSQLPQPVRHSQFRYPSFYANQADRWLAQPALRLTIGSRKVIPDIRTYVTIDGGMSDNPDQSPINRSIEQWWLIRCLLRLWSR